MLAARRAREHGELLGLRARAHDHRAPRPLAAELRRRHRGARRPAQLAHLLGDVDVAAHAAARAARRSGRWRRRRAWRGRRGRCGWRSRSGSTRPGAAATTSAIGWAAVVSLAVRPGRGALVESPNRASTPARPSAAEAGPVDAPARVRQRVVELVVAREDDRADRRLDGQRRGVRDGVRHAHELDGEGAGRHPLARHGGHQRRQRDVGLRRAWPAPARS